MRILLEFDLSFVVDFVFVVVVGGANVMLKRKRVKKAMRMLNELELNL